MWWYSPCRTISDLPPLVSFECHKMLQGIIKEMVFYVYVQHALIQMTLNISFLFWLNKQTAAAQQLCIIMRTWLWSLYSCGQQEGAGRANQRKKSRMNVEKNARKITDLGEHKKAPAYTFLCHKFRMNIRTLGISPFIKMFDLYSFFISFAPQLFPFCPLYSCILLLPSFPPTYHFLVARVGRSILCSVVLNVVFS